MILVIGGSHQGKTAFAHRLAAGERDAEVVLNFHHCIKGRIQSGQEVEPFVRQVIAANPRVVVMTEVGYGIVPMEAGERQYREAVGLAGQMLAAEAESVYRLVCGIATKIK